MMIKPTVSLKARALRLLSMREHSRLELARKLSRYTEQDDEIETVLNAMEAANFLSSERFSESLVHRRQARFGNQRILAELQSHGLDKTQIEHLKEGLAESELSRAVEVLSRKFKFQGVPDQLTRNKQRHFLQMRGFSSKSIQAALRIWQEQSIALAEISEADSE